MNLDDIQPSETLLAALHAVRQKSSKGTYFISFLHLQRVLTRLIIVQEVDRFCPQQHHKSHIVDVIHRNGLRVFGILVLLGQEKLIIDFIENLDDQLDSKLPFEQAQISRISANVSFRFCKEVQWELIPHLFQGGGFHRKILNDVILPYTEEERFDEGSGGEIFRCVIASGQHKLAPQQVHPSRLMHWETS